MILCQMIKLAVHKNTVITPLCQSLKQFSSPSHSTSISDSHYLFFPHVTVLQGWQLVEKQPSIFYQGLALF